MPKFSSNLKRVERAFSREGLARVCAMPEEDFAAAYDMDTYGVDQREPHDFYHFRDNGSNVLAVAHLDTVSDASEREAHFLDTSGGPVVYSRALDDRLGAYIILDLLPELLGHQYDVLLTTGEEMGASTAAFFEPDKDYDWMIEFDRGGTDVVMYQYEDEETCDAVRRVGARVGDGIFSDISYMDHLGCKGWNWGVGYQDYHGPRAHAYLDDTMMMVARFLNFDHHNRGVYYPHTPKVTDSWMGYGRSSRSYSNLWSWDDDAPVTPLDDAAEPEDFDYVSEHPTLEELQRLEERLDREREREREDEEDRQRRYEDLLVAFDR